MRAFRVARLLDVDIHIHPTFLLIVAWAVARWGFGSDGGVGSLLLGLVFVLLIMVSVVVHELGHVLMAREFGVRVLDVTLWPFGGVARIEQIPAHSRAEFMISLAGPAMNFAIFVALLPVLILVGLIGGRDALLAGAELFDRITLVGLLTYVALTNLFIMVFNLIPAFPMDGGRVLRAALVNIVGRDRATTVAVTLGSLLALLAAVWGVWDRSLVLVAVGIFVAIAAQAEARAAHAEEGMRRLRVGQFSLWDMGGISPDQPLTLAMRGGPRDLVVTKNGEVLGMLWRADLLRSLQGGMGGRTVADVMDRSVYVADVNDSVLDVQRVMNSLNRWAVPVTENGQYRGIFTAERFVHLHRQVMPPVFSGWSLPEPWRDAIRHNLRVRR
ncbi:MAG TPA: site-2 protease family protein [Thermomicrobiales bacterium]|nr:site-2 protease family protein [Thermomicrobiales bacterium]